eukprot:7375994-Prymnesium_polylepis.3
MRRASRPLTLISSAPASSKNWNSESGGEGHTVEGSGVTHRRSDRASHHVAEAAGPRAAPSSPPPASSRWYLTARRVGRRACRRS